jgi:Surface lipoprotein assembly modifier
LLLMLFGIASGRLSGMKCVINLFLLFTSSKITKNSDLFIQQGNTMRSFSYALLTSVCVLSFNLFTVNAQAKELDSKSKWSGAISVGVSTDRNAGAAPASLRGGSSGGKSKGSKGSADDEDEDEDDAEVFDDGDITGDDLLDDLDLDEPDLQDQIDDLEDEADGIEGNEDLDGDGFADGDADGDGLVDDADGDGVADEGGDANGDGVADGGVDNNGDGIADGGGDADGDGVADAPADPAAEPVVDAAADPAPDAGGGDAGGGDPFLRTSAAPAKKAAAVKLPPKGKRGDRLTVKAGVANSYAFNKDFAWKTGASITSAFQRQNKKNDNRIMALTSGPEFKSLGGDLTWGPSLAYAHMTKDSKHIFDLYAASFGAKYKLTKKLGIKGKYTYSATNFEIARADTSYGQKLGFALAAKPFKQTTSELGWSFNTVNVSPAEKEKDGQQVSLKLQQDFPYEIYLAGVASYKFTEFDVAKKREPLRKDRDLNVGVSIGKEVWKDINMELQYDHRAFDTNIVGKDVSNDRFALVTGWKF